MINQGCQHKDRKEKDCLHFEGEAGTKQDTGEKALAFEKRPQRQQAERHINGVALAPHAAVEEDSRQEKRQHRAGELPHAADPRLDPQQPHDSARQQKVKCDGNGFHTNERRYTGASQRGEQAEISERVVAVWKRLLKCRKPAAGGQRFVPLLQEVDVIVTLEWNQTQAQNQRQCTAEKQNQQGEMP